MIVFRSSIAVTCALLIAVGLARPHAQATADPQRVQLPAGGATLEGIPTVRIDTSQGGATRKVLTAAEAKQDRVTISKVDGQYFWASRQNKLLQLNSSGPYTYLSAEPGSYIRLTRINDRIDYVEHLDSPLGSVTWWGELRVVVGDRKNAR
jgi:hypothetical protein